MTATVTPIFLKNVASGQAINAELLDAVEQQQLIDWVMHWLPVRDKYLHALKTAQAPAAAWPQSAHWNWVSKVVQIQGLLAHRALCVVCENVTQGMMRIDVAGKRCRIASQKGLDLVYVDYLEIAPWNWEGPYFDPPRYRGVGTVLLRAAIETSLAEGFKGRIGLHSLPQSTIFYERCGLTNCGPDPASQWKLPYFEMTPENTQAFLGKGTRQ